MIDTFDTSRPIYIQIVERLTHKIIAGEYQAGARLAPVRELAATLGVNPNTLQRAFAELERQGLLYTERTAGRFVTQDQAIIIAVRDAMAQHVVADFVKQMAQMGYTNAQLVDFLLAQAAGEQAQIVACVDGASAGTDVTDTADRLQPVAPAQMNEKEA